MDMKLFSDEVAKKANEVGQGYAKQLADAGVNVPQALLAEGFALCWREGHLHGVETASKIVFPKTRNIIERIFR